jgi:hypothetical protein
MMMSKPKSDATSTSHSTTTTSSAPPNNTTTSNPADAVADLERRLADLSAATPQIPQPAANIVQPTTTTASSAVSNKNALLVSVTREYKQRLC